MGVVHANPQPIFGDRPDYITFGQFVQDHTGVSCQQVAEVVLDVAAADITFSSIPQTYRSLVLAVVARSDGATTGTNFAIQFNGDTGGNYDIQHVYGTGSAGNGFEAFAGTFAHIGRIPGASDAAGLAGSAHTVIPAYTRTDFHKVFSSCAAFKLGTATTNLISYTIAGFWRNAAAITDIRIFAQTGNLDVGSIATLWGMV